MTSHRLIDTNSVLCGYILGLMLLIVACPTSSSVADDFVHSRSIQSQDRIPQRDRLDFEAGYFTARRGDFREVYGSGATFAASFEHRINKRFGWGLRSTIGKQSLDAGLRYWSLTICPHITLTVVESKTFRRVIGVGLGAGYRHVNLAASRTTEHAPDIAASYTVTQRSFGAFTMAMAGFDLRLSERFCFGGRAYFDYYFTDQLFGDVKRGDFGDTGGLSFTGRIGFAL